MVASRLSARSLESQLGHWRAREPAYAALADAVRLLCLDNRIAPRTALPAERELAQRLGLSRTTVAAAYRSLRESGHIESLRGSGSVTQPLPRGELAAATAGEGAIDLQQASPAAWPGLAAVYAEVLADAPAILARSGYSVAGSASLRAAIADRYTGRGVPTTAEQVMIVNGAQSAIWLVAALLVSRGDRVVIETPTYPHAAEAFRQAGARLIGVPVGVGDGWDLERAAQAFRRSSPIAAYLMPDFQNPTGASMSDEERREIVAAASSAGCLIVADETTAELSIDGDVSAPLAALDPDGPIVTLGSFGKTVWGGLRIGWIRASAATVRRLVALRPSIDLGTPEMEQAVAERLIPLLPEVVAQRARTLREGRDAVCDRLDALLPEWDVPRGGGGVAVWAGLGAPLSSSLVIEARRRGLLLSAGPRFSVDGGHERHLRVPFTAPVADLARATEVLAECWHELGGAALGRDVLRAEDAVV